MHPADPISGRQALGFSQEALQLKACITVGTRAKHTGRFLDHVKPRPQGARIGPAQLLTSPSHCSSLLRGLEPLPKIRMMLTNIFPGLRAPSRFR